MDCNTMWCGIIQVRLWQVKGNGMSVPYASIKHKAPVLCCTFSAVRCVHMCSLCVLCVVFMLSPTPDCLFKFNPLFLASLLRLVLCRFHFIIRMALRSSLDLVIGL